MSRVSMAKKFVFVMLALLLMATLFAMRPHAMYLTQTNGSGEKFYLNMYGNSMYSGRKLSVYYTTTPGGDQSFFMNGIDGFLRPTNAQNYAVNKSTEQNHYFNPVTNYAIVWPIATGRNDSEFSIGLLSTGNNVFQLLHHTENRYLGYAYLIRPSNMSDVDYANGGYYAYFKNSMTAWKGESE